MERDPSELERTTLPSEPAMRVGGERARGEIWLRYEDVSQDGRVQLGAMAASLGVVWRKLIARHPIVPACRAQGIIPILTRFVIEGEGGPFAIDGQADVDGTFGIARTVGASGETDRLMLEISTRLSAPIGRTNLPPPPDAGRVATMGTVLAQHVFTRPFADASERKVLSIAELGPSVALPVHPWASPHALVELPEGARPLEDALAPDAADVVFGTAHTDSNQHVNSLVYPRLFEDAVLRRLAALGQSTQRLARSVDVRYRKPSFHGDSVRVWLRAYEREGRVGAVGAFVEPGGAPDKARVYLRVELE